MYHAVRDFTADPVSFPPDEMRALIQELVLRNIHYIEYFTDNVTQAANNQHYIPIVDAAVAHQSNASDLVSS